MQITLDLPYFGENMPTFATRLNTGWSVLLLLISLFTAPLTVQATESDGVPLVIGNRTIHIFRVPLGMFSPAERATSARQRIERSFEQSGEGWTSIKPGPQGIEVMLDGTPLFLVMPGDARELAGETPEDLANQASRTLQKAWNEARERRDPRASLAALLRVALATVLLIGALALIVKVSFRLRTGLIRQLENQLQALPESSALHRLAGFLPSVLARGLILLSWLLSLFLIFIYLTYSLAQFVLTRPASETLSQSLATITAQAFSAIAEALPGMFIATLIFLAAWVATRVSTEFFTGVTTRPDDSSVLNAHTAFATRRIVNASLWLFAVAMAYPYLPGSHTEAFKGLSVLLGLMVSIGASGVIGQIASGMMIVYTYALKKGEYVRIQDYEGTVTELDLFVTRLRTGMGEEISLPNAFVLANVTRNFSRASAGKAYVLDVTVTIGYDTPWRQVHAMLLEAAGSIPEILSTPPAYVVQTALADFYVAYKLIVQVDSEVPATRARIASDLHAAIQDSFNRYGVQIMSPHYMDDPQTPKVVAVSSWAPRPARPEDSDSLSSGK
ncbi:MAG: mechanosensitive ion channel protein MscS [Rhodocyclaceae bacterium]|nr:mechanosensitive ion channel protein MscS [Rhodocyclaceae bacterium]